MTTGDLVEFVRSAELFQGVDVAAVSELARELKIVEIRDREVLIRQGDSNQNLYLVVSGRLRVTRHDQRHGASLLFEVQPGESVGEMAILSDGPASATVTAADDARVVGLSQDVFKRFSAASPEAALQVAQSLSRCQQRHRLSIALHLSNLFDTPDPDVLRDLESELATFTLYGGEVLFRQGEPGDYFCIVISGRLRVVVLGGHGEEIAITELGPGELVGEMAVVGNQPRSATIDAVRDSQLARLTKAAFDRFMTKHPKPAVEMVSRKLAERLRDTTAGRIRRSRTLSTLAIIPAHPSAPKAEFSKGLAAVLSRFGPCLHLTSAAVDEHLGQPGIAQTYQREGGNIRLVEWLNTQEIEHSYVLYEADPFLSPWTERCIRQADHVIVVADGAGDPAPGEIETELLCPHDGRPVPRQWLALVHGQSGPSGTKRWLEVRNVERHCHVRLGEDVDFERLARLITGRGIGLTLGGGFARGLAHVGVFRAFADLGVAIDAIGGASMGAMIGALWAMGWEGERIIRETSEACSGAFGDLTFPFIAFKSGRKFSDAVKKLFGEIQIEDLWIPYFCTSANLNRSELKLHTRGPLAKAVLAATRAPGVFPPIVFDGELHIDGGIINNVPVDLMKIFCNEGITVGVDVSPPHELPPVHDYGDQVSGWRAFWRRCNPFSNHRVYTPSILLVMIRTLEYTGISYKNLRVEFADIYMHPDLLKFKRTDFHLATEIVKAGYEAARAKVLEWLAASDVAATRRPDLAGVVARAEGSKAHGVKPDAADRIGIASNRITSSR
jgi:CRP-like cAMP-binding protein/predicted acylesterase/phospholipase RssA